MDERFNLGDAELPTDMAALMALLADIGMRNYAAFEAGEGLLHELVAIAALDCRLHLEEKAAGFEPIEDEGDAGSFEPPLTLEPLRAHLVAIATIARSCVGRDCVHEAEHAEVAEVTESALASVEKRIAARGDA